ncbi:MAG TPA: hypothetical protein VL178_00950 [Pseudomonas sp.]|nr:hypothetical protein [Pseudomonas sp.]
MSTTTIDLPEELSERVRQAAERAGLSQQGFILLAMEEKTRQEARRYDFEQTADQRYEQIQATGESLSWSDMRRYLEDHAVGKESLAPCAWRASS